MLNALDLRLQSFLIQRRGVRGLELRKKGTISVNDKLLVLASASSPNRGKFYRSLITPEESISS